MKSRILSANIEYKTKLKEKFNLEKSYKFLANLSLLITLISIIWIFINFMIPANGSVGFNNYINATGFYTVKYASDFQSYSISLTASGIGLVIWMILSLILYVITGISHAKHHKQERQSWKENPDLKPTKKIVAAGFTNMFAFLFLLVVTLILFIFILIPPSVGDIKNMFHANFIIAKALNENGNDLGTLTNLCKQLGIKLPDNATLGVVKSALSGYNAFHNVAFTPFYTWLPTQFVIKKNSIDAGIVLFSLALIFNALARFVAYRLRVSANKQKSFDRQTMKDLLKQYKEARKEKQAIKQNKKELLEQENELLKNLYEIDKDLNQNKADDLTPIQKINQQELEEKINKNNELKKQLEELNKQKAELKKKSISNSKIKSALHKAQNQNIKQTRNKKQEIAVPDKELEEIFKSLDID